MWQDEPFSTARSDGGEQDGLLRTAQVVEAGISKSVFYEYVKDRKMERVAHGIYVSKDSWIDAMYLIHLRLARLYFPMKQHCFSMT